MNELSVRADPAHARRRGRTSDLASKITNSKMKGVSESEGMGKARGVGVDSPRVGRVPRQGAPSHTSWVADSNELNGPTRPPEGRSDLGIRLAQPVDDVLVGDSHGLL